MKKTTLLGVVFCSLFLFSNFLYAAGPDEIVIGFTDDALTMDPANHRARTTETILRDMYDGLVVRNSKMEVVPQIAEDWEQGHLLTIDDIPLTSWMCFSVNIFGISPFHWTRRK